MEQFFYWVLNVLVMYLILNKWNYYYTTFEKQENVKINMCIEKVY